MLQILQKNSSSKRDQSKIPIIRDLFIMVFIKNLVPLSLLYCFEGILLGLILHSIPKELLDSGIDIGIYKFRFLILIPYMLRYIVAPLLDSLSWEKGGRRRSQLCVLYFLLGYIKYIEIEFCYFFQICNHWINVFGNYFGLFVCWHASIY